MRPTVVELFTSQGCSSCPPADALLGELAKRADVIAVAFHVDYWNDLGWIDPFSSPTATQRQNRYARALDLPSAFTPQVVIDGRRSVLGSDQQGIVPLLTHTAAASALELEIAADQLVITAPGGEPVGSLDVNLIAYLSRAATPIGRGENSGRVLTEYNIVQLFKRVGSWQGKPATIKVPLASLPATADRIAVLLQTPNQGAIVGAAAIQR